MHGTKHFLQVFTSGFLVTAVGPSKLFFPHEINCKGWFLDRFTRLPANIAMHMDVAELFGHRPEVA